MLIWWFDIVLCNTRAAQNVWIDYLWLRIDGGNLGFYDDFGLEMI
jgi:hypothetical protein